MSRDLWGSILEGIQAANELGKSQQQQKYGDIFAQQEEKSQDLANQLAQAQLGMAGLKLQNMPQEYQEQAAQNALKQQLMQAQIQSLLKPKDYRYQSPVAKMQMDLSNIKAQYGTESPQAKQLEQAIEMSIQPKQGVQVFDPTTGRPLVQMGGTGGSSRSGGQITVNPDTGVISALPTPAMKTYDEKSLAGSENVQNFLDIVKNTMPRFLDPITQNKIRADKAVYKYTGIPSDLLSQYNYALSSLKSSAEGLQNQFGLRSTDKSRDYVLNLITPKGDTPKGYHDRIEKQMIDYLKMRLGSEGRLKSGQKIGESTAFGQTSQPSTSRNPVYDPSTGKWE